MKLHYIVKHSKTVIVNKLNYISYPLFIITILLGLAYINNLYSENKEFKNTISVQKETIDVLSKQVVEKDRENSELKAIITENELKIIELSKEVNYKNVVISKINSKLKKYESIKILRKPLDMLRKSIDNSHITTYIKLDTVNSNEKLGQISIVSTMPMKVYHNCDNYNTNEDKIDGFKKINIIRASMISDKRIFVNYG